MAFNATPNIIKYQTINEITSEPIIVPLAVDNCLVLALQQDHRLILDTRTIKLEAICYPLSPIYAQNNYSTPQLPVPMDVDKQKDIFHYNQQTSTTDLAYFTPMVMSVPVPAPRKSKKVSFDRSTMAELDVGNEREKGNSDSAYQQWKQRKQNSASYW
jgi:hypothetical protein